ncbi:MAG: tetratricopeptide repeat protein, partial [Nitrospirae bacterium]|nr:tetratricopeptide repeat protein [Nitrospirota bacterium]
AMLSSSEQVAGSRKNVGELGNSEQATRSRFKDLPTTCYLLPATSFVALASALIFAVHPFNSEVVNYITARSSVMSAFFYLLAFYGWVRFREVGNSGSSKQVAGKVAGSSEQVAGKSATRYPLPATRYLLPATRYPLPATCYPLPATCYLLPATYYIASLLAFMLGLLTKEIVITLPVILWLYDLYFVYPGHDARRFPFVEHFKRLAIYIPFLLLVAIPYLILRGYLTGGRIHEGTLPRSYYVNIITGTKVLVKYLQMFVIPLNLSVDHVIQNASSFREWGVIASSAFLAGILILTLWLSRRYTLWRVGSFFILWFFITLLPTTIIPLEAMLQENRAYLASISLAVIGGILLGKVAGSWREEPETDGLRRDRPSGLSVTRWRIYASIALIGILIAIYSTMTLQRNRVWKDELTLWGDAVNKYPSSARAHFALGNFYKRNLDIPMAIRLYKKVVEIDPDYYEAYNNLGVLYYKEESLDQAAEEFKKALNISPSYINARMGLGEVYMKKGDIEMAKREIKSAMALAEFTHQDDVAKKAMFYLKWIDERNNLRRRQE